MKFSFTYNLATLLTICFFFISETATAQFDIPPKPSKQEQTSVYDYVNLLNPSEKAALTNKLLRYSDTTSTQIVVAIINTTQGEDISLLGAKWGQTWGVGQAREDNGIFIILAKEDRMIDINTGYGIESIMSDRTTEQIINRIIIPQFKTGNYYTGLDKGTDAIFQVLNGEFKEDRTFKNENSNIPFIVILIVFLIIIIILRSRNNRGGNGGGGSSLLDVIILSNMGRTGGFGSSSGGFGGGGSFGGGGFGGGFGGGGFGGGGASGSW